MVYNKPALRDHFDGIKYPNQNFFWKGEKYFLTYSLCYFKRSISIEMGEMLQIDSEAAAIYNSVFQF